VFNDADIEMAQLTAAGNAAARGSRRMRRLRADGRLAEAAAACHHGAGYGTDGSAAVDIKDPRAGQRGHRCSECGSWWRGSVNFWELRETAPDVPCELEPR